MNRPDPTQPGPMPETDAPVTSVRWFGLVLLIGQVALLCLGAMSLWRIAGGWWIGALAAAVFLAAYAVVWRFWLAPGSGRRLRYRERLTLNLVLGPIVVVLGSLASLWLPALLATSVVLLCDALDQRTTIVPQDLL